MKAVEVQRCARVAVERCAGVRAGERVLIVTDTMRHQSVAQALMGAALAANGEDPSFEGERVFGWTHVSTGSNATFPGGTVRANIHLDGIISRPTIYLDDETILQGGEFLGEFA